MFSKKLLIATLIATVINFLSGYVWYEVLMKDYFPAAEGVTRDAPLMIFIIIGVLIFSYAFCRLYQLTFDDDMPVMGQALRFGVLISLLFVVSYSLFNYATSTVWGVNHIVVDGIYNIVILLITAVVIGSYLGADGGRSGGGEKDGGPTRGGGEKDGGPTKDDGEKGGGPTGLK